VFGEAPPTPTCAPLPRISPRADQFRRISCRVGAFGRKEATMGDDEPRNYAETRDEQAEFEQLLREHDGDYQAAVDAQRRGEKPKGEPAAPSGA
jgi:hypothetical protein